MFIDFSANVNRKLAIDQASTETTNAKVREEEREGRREREREGGKERERGPLFMRVAIAIPVMIIYILFVSI